jgi:hypothetical protein
MDLEELEALPVPQSKSELLARIGPARRALEDLITSLSAGGLDRIDDEGWRVRDHLSHISAWERMLVAHLTDGADHLIVRLSPAEYAEADLQQINDRLHDIHRSDATDDVLVEFGASHGEMMALIERLDDSALAQPYWDDDPAKRPVIEKLTGDTYRHYLEHRRWIAAIASRSQAGA